MRMTKDEEYTELMKKVSDSLRKIQTQTSQLQEEAPKDEDVAALQRVTNELQQATIGANNNILTEAEV